LFFCLCRPYVRCIFLFVILKKRICGGGCCHSVRAPYPRVTPSPQSLSSGIVAPATVVLPRFPFCRLRPCCRCEQSRSCVHRQHRRLATIDPAIAIRLTRLGTSCCGARSRVGARVPSAISHLGRELR